MNRFRFLLTLALLPLSLVACSDDNGPALDPDDYLGAYFLQTIDGDELPKTVQLEGADIRVDQATAHLEHDLDWGLYFQGALGGMNIDPSFEGSYTISGNKLTLKVMDEGWENVIRTLTGTIKVETETLTIVYNGMTLVFKKGELPPA